jgi:hypothetical protein
MSPNGKYVAIRVYFGLQRPLEVHLLEDGNLIRRFTDDRGTLSGVDVSDSGHVLVCSVEGFPMRTTGHVLVFDREGTLRWNDTLKGEGVTSGGISPEGGFAAFVSESSLYLHRIGGQRLWVTSVGQRYGSHLEKVSVAAGAFRIVVWDSLQDRAYVFDRDGKHLWEGNCMFPGPRISSSGDYVGLILLIPDDPQKDVAVARFDADLGDGEWVGLPTGIHRDLMSEGILDYSLSDRGDVVLVTRPENVFPPGDGMKYYDAQLREVKVGERYFFYDLGDPRGAHEQSTPAVVLSSDGTVMAVSTGTEVRGLKNAPLTKKW